MGYAPARGRRRNLLPNGALALEAAMRDRDLSSRELGKLAATSGQTVSQLRLDVRQSVAAEVADAIERALRVPHGKIFGNAYDTHGYPAGRVYVAAS